MKNMTEERICKSILLNYKRGSEEEEKNHFFRSDKYYDKSVLLLRALEDKTGDLFVIDKISENGEVILKIRNLNTSLIIYKEKWGNV